MCFVLSQQNIKQKEQKVLLCWISVTVLADVLCIGFDVLSIFRARLSESAMADVSALQFVPVTSTLALAPVTIQKTRKRSPGSGQRAGKIHQNGPQRCPNGAQKSTNWAPRSHQVRKTYKNKSPRVAKWSPKRYNGVAGPPKVQEKHKKVSQSASKTRKCAARCRKTHKHT